MTYEEAILNQIAERGITMNDGKFRPKYMAHGKTVWLGSFDYLDDAEHELLIHRVEYLKREVSCFGYDLRDAEVIFENYIMFEDGTIFNLYGKMMNTFYNQYGIEFVNLNGTTYGVKGLILNQCKKINTQFLHTLL